MPNGISLLFEAANILVLRGKQRAQMAAKHSKAAAKERLNST